MRAQGARAGDRKAIEARLGYQAAPLEESLARLGRKWTLLILRDIAFLHLRRFNEFLRNNPGLTPRVLSRRLKEMRSEGLITRSTRRGEVSYRLTARGSDAVYILLAFLRYGLRHHRLDGVRPPPTLR